MLKIIIYFLGPVILNLIVMGIHKLIFFKGSTKDSKLEWHHVYGVSPLYFNIQLHLLIGYPHFMWPNYPGGTQKTSYFKDTPLNLCPKLAYMFVPSCLSNLFVELVCPVHYLVRQCHFHKNKWPFCMIGVSVLLNNKSPMKIERERKK